MILAKNSSPRFSVYFHEAQLLQHNISLLFSFRVTAAAAACCHDHQMLVFNAFLHECCFIVHRAKADNAFEQTHQALDLLETLADSISKVLFGDVWDGDYFYFENDNSMTDRRIRVNMPSPHQLRDKLSRMFVETLFFADSML